MSTPAVNLPQVLLPEAQGIYQLLTNANYELWPLRPVVANYPSEWPEQNRIRYHLGESKNTGIILEMRNIHVRDCGPIYWMNEEQVGSSQVEDVVLVDVDLPEGVDFDRMLSYTFTAVKTLEESTRLSFTTELEARFGSTSAPFAARINEKVADEFSSKFGTAETHAETQSDHFKFSGPRRLLIKAVREVQEVRRETSCKPFFDYEIAMIWDYPDGYIHVGWSSKEEFVNFIRGLTPDSVAISEQRMKSKSVIFPDDHVIHKALSPYFREHPQPNAQIGEHVEPMQWVDTYPNVLKQSIIVS